MIKFRVGDTDIYAVRLVRVARREQRRAEREAVARLVECAFGRDAVLCHTPAGAPFIVDFDGYISISHGADFAVLAVNQQQPVGVDVERWRISLLTVAPRVLDDAEMQACGGDRMSLLRAWTAKEAIFKAAGIPTLTLPEIRLPGSVGRCRFSVSYFTRGERVLALALKER